MKEQAQKVIREWEEKNGQSERSFPTPPTMADLHIRYPIFKNNAAINKAIRRARSKGDAKYAEALVEFKRSHFNQWIGTMYDCSLCGFSAHHLPLDVDRIEPYTDIDVDLLAGMSSTISRNVMLWKRQRQRHDRTEARAPEVAAHGYGAVFKSERLQYLSDVAADEKAIQRAASAIPQSTAPKRQRASDLNVSYKDYCSRKRQRQLIK
jgi:hypothetical protein